MTKAKCGAAVVADADGELLGIFTDGDFRRIVSERGTEEKVRVQSSTEAAEIPSSNSNSKLQLNKSPIPLSSPVSLYMTKSPLFVYDDAYAAELLKIFEKKRIDDLPVCDRSGRVVGLVDIQDLPKMKVL
jgi:arabinose-5-phosphate isomerase